MTASDTAEPTRARSSLRVASGLLGLGTVATRLTTLVLMALLAREAGIASVGYYGLATLSASLAATVVSLGLPTYLTRDVAAGVVPPSEVALIHLVRLGVLAATVAVAYPLAQVWLTGDLLGAFVLFFGGTLLDQWNETAWVLVRGGPSAWLEPLTNAGTGVLLVAACGADAWLSNGLTIGRAGTFVVLVAFARSTAALALTGVPRHLRAMSSAGVPRHLRAVASTGVPLHLPAVSSARVPLHRRTSTRVRLGAHVRRALPYFASDLLGLAYFRGDVFVLALFVSAGQVGDYVSAAGLVGPAIQLAASMGVGALAYAAPRFAAGQPSAADPATVDPATVVRFFQVAGYATAGAMFVTLPIAVRVLFGAQGRTTLLLAMVLTLFLVLRFPNFGLSTLLMAAGHANRRVMVLVLSILANVMVNLLLDGRYGALGAAWATVLTEVVVAASLAAFLRSGVPLRPVMICVAAVAAGGLAMVGLLMTLDRSTAAVATGLLFLVAAGVGLLRRPRVALPAPIAAVEC